MYVCYHLYLNRTGLYELLPISQYNTIHLICVTNSKSTEQAYTCYHSYPNITLSVLYVLPIIHQQSRCMCYHSLPNITALYVLPIIHQQSRCIFYHSWSNITGLYVLPIIPQHIRCMCYDLWPYHSRIMCVTTYNSA